MTSEDCEVTESVSEGGPSSRTFNPRRTKRRRQRRAVSRERPATATLAHPNILDESLKVSLNFLSDPSFDFRDLIKCTINFLL